MADAPATTDPAAPPASGQPAAGQPATPPAAAPTSPTGQPRTENGQFAAPNGADSVDHWKEQARQWESRAREQKAQGEQLKAQEAVLRQMAEKLGVQVEGTPDPAKLTAQVESAQAQQRQAATELAVFRAAAATGANADALLDSRAFMAKLGTLDPTDPLFAETVRNTVTQQITANPTLAAANGQLQPPAAPTVHPLPANSGAPNSAPNEGPRQWTMDDVQRATPEQLDKAISDGLCVDLGVGRGRHTRARRR